MLVELVRAISAIVESIRAPRPGDHKTVNRSFVAETASDAESGRTIVGGRFWSMRAVATTRSGSAATGRREELKRFVTSRHVEGYAVAVAETERITTQRETASWRMPTNRSHSPENIMIFSAEALLIAHPPDL